MLGGSSYTWDHKHNTIHHTYANIADHDDDIDLGWFGRLAPTQRRLWFHRAQHFYLWVLYGLMPIKWHVWDDFRDVARGRIGLHRFARPRGLKLGMFIGGKTLFMCMAFVVPALVHPFWQVLLFYALTCWINGVLISVVFQLAHAVEQAEFPLPDQVTGRMPSDWAVHQVQTTVNFARRNKVLTWFLGGLNFQIEHHLFPRISHVHYPRISRLVESACRRFDLTYNEHANTFAAIASHYRWLRQMGRRQRCDVVAG
jgi:linoleoyl-CoA desaturase